MYFHSQLFIVYKFSPTYVSVHTGPSPGGVQKLQFIYSHRFTLSYEYTGHTQTNGAVLTVFTIKTAPFFCVCPVCIHYSQKDSGTFTQIPQLLSHCTQIPQLLSQCTHGHIATVTLYTDPTTTVTMYTRAHSYCHNVHRSHSYCHKIHTGT
jgi:hypothetical protein